jgi:RNA polymerase sigma-70 factor (ECF subfamily)
MVALSSDRSEEPAAPAEGPPGTDLAAIYDEYFAFVWRSLRALGVAPSFLDDAAQEVFLVVHRRVGQFAWRSSLRTWLFGIAYRVAANHRRQTRRRETFELPQEVISQELDPHEHAERAEAARFVQAFMETLSQANRAAFIACVLERLTVPEAAEALGVNVNTLYSRVRSLRSKFIEALSAEGVHNER